jgi:hypothetical protein
MTVLVRAISNLPDRSQLVAAGKGVSIEAESYRLLGAAT